MIAINNIFKFQIWHLLSLIILIFAVKVYMSSNSEVLDGSFLNVDTISWLWLAIAVPITHQVYVWLVWRFELYQRVFTQKFGVKRAFNFYAIGFSLLFVARLIAIIILAISNKESLYINPIISYSLAAIITVPVIYLFYSVKKYFTVERAYGIDHFDRNYNEPYVKRGIFKYTDNGMYIFFIRSSAFSCVIQSCLHLGALLLHRTS